MRAITAPSPALIRSALAMAALASWGVALWQAMPRLLAGPICSARQDAFSLAGHCPACFIAVGLTLALLAHCLRAPVSQPATATR